MTGWMFGKTLVRKPGSSWNEAPLSPHRASHPDAMCDKNASSGTAPDPAPTTSVRARGNRERNAVSPRGGAENADFTSIPTTAAPAWRTKSTSSVPSRHHDTDGPPSAAVLSRWAPTQLSTSRPHASGVLAPPRLHDLRPARHLLHLVEDEPGARSAGGSRGRVPVPVDPVLTRWRRAVCRGVHEGEAAGLRGLPGHRGLPDLACRRGRLLRTLSIFEGRRFMPIQGLGAEVAQAAHVDLPGDGGGDPGGAAPAPTSPFSPRRPLDRQRVRAASRWRSTRPSTPSVAERDRCGCWRTTTNATWAHRPGHGRPRREYRDRRGRGDPQRKRAAAPPAGKSGGGPPAVG